METRDRPPLLIKIIGPPMFLIGGVFSIWWFICRAYVLFDGLSSEIVVFDKGAFYMFGAGVGLLTLGLVMVQEGWMMKDLTKKQASSFGRWVISGLVLAFLVPHASQFFLDEHLEDSGYSVCTEASSQWLHVRTIVYVKDAAECREGLGKQ